MLAFARFRPDPRLRGIVRDYHARTGHATPGAAPLPLVASTETRLDFYFTRATALVHRLTGELSRPPAVTLVGPRTCRQHDLRIEGAVDILSLQFEATGLHALLGLPMSALADAAASAGDVLEGSGIDELHARMAQDADPRRRVLLLEEFLIALRQRRPAPGGAGALEWAVATLRAQGGQPRIEWLAEEAGLSARHFSRLFKQQVGLSPKTYARIIRLQSVIASKSAQPAGTWAALAQEHGYFDQAHLDKEFRALAGLPPSTWPLADLARERGATSDSY